MFILSDLETLKTGEKVRGIAGGICGIERELYRIRGHKRVAVRLGRLASVATELYTERVFGEN